jgi:hypothetical protein
VFSTLISDFDNANFILKNTTSGLLVKALNLYQHKYNVKKTH